MVDVRTNNKLERYFNVAKVLLTLSPFIGLFYIMMNGNVESGNIMQVINQDPKLAILFLTCMINPFIAYLLVFMQGKLKEGDPSYAVVNLVVLVGAEVVLQNVVYVMLLGFLLYKISKSYSISVKESYVEKSSSHLFRTISGSIVVLVLACFCLFAQTRIGF